jgi:adenylate cyclase
MAPAKSLPQPEVPTTLRTLCANLPGVSATGISPDLAGASAGGRRLIAVVYADMVGYSRLIGLDDVGTLKRLRALRNTVIDPTIHEHSGRVVNTGGDSLLIVFESVEGAVSCAVKVQQQVPAYDGDQPPDRAIRFRVGINVGDVIPDGTDVHGDVVNVAARLQAECPPGGICVSRTVRDHVHGRLNLAFEPVGELTLKNIAHPVEAFVLRLDSAAQESATDAALAGPRARWRAALCAGLAGLLLFGAGGAVWWLYRGAGILPIVTQVSPTSSPATTQAYTPPNIGLSKAPRLSIVVLPFENLSRDHTEDYMADGVTEDVTTDLSRVPGMFVVARESAYTYQGKPIDVRKVGEELGVRYVLEGSVRKLGDALRVNAQLIATETGAHLWADRFDQKLNDLSSGLDEIVGRIVQTLGVALTDVESVRSKRERPTNPDAFDLILRAQSLGLHPMGPEEHSERRALLEQALRLNPNSIYAMTQLVNELVMRQNVGITGQGENARAAQLIAAAAASNPDDPFVLDATAYLLFSSGRYIEAISAYQHLLDEYPNAHGAYHLIGYCLISSGRAEEAIPMFEMAMRRDPRSALNYDRYAGIGIALLLLERDAESIVWQQRALAAVRTGYTALRAQYNLRLTAAYARLGNYDEAHHALAEANRLWPYATVRSHSPSDPSNRVVAGQIERFQAALRLAGLRDHAAEDADFRVAADGDLRQDYAGLTPTTVPGATTIQTVELVQLLSGRKPIVIDPLLYSWGRSIPGAVGLKNAGHGGSTSDEMQDRLRGKMHELSKGKLNTPIVATSWNTERFDGRNLALRLVALGYTDVYWYRGGREAWEVAGLPETEVDVQDW